MAENTKEGQGEKTVMEPRIERNVTPSDRVCHAQVTSASSMPKTRGTTRPARGTRRGTRGNKTEQRRRKAEKQGKGKKRKRSGKEEVSENENIEDEEKKEENDNTNSDDSWDSIDDRRVERLKEGREEIMVEAIKKVERRKKRKENRERKENRTDEGDENGGPIEGPNGEGEQKEVSREHDESKGESNDEDLGEEANEGDEGGEPHGGCGEGDGEQRERRTQTFGITSVPGAQHPGGSDRDDESQRGEEGNGESEERTEPSIGGMFGDGTRQYPYRPTTYHQRQVFRTAPHITLSYQPSRAKGQQFICKVGSDNSRGKWYFNVSVNVLYNNVQRMHLSIHHRACHMIMFPLVE